jgi:hypothetical protein
VEKEAQQHRHLSIEPPKNSKTNNKDRRSEHDQPLLSSIAHSPNRLLRTTLPKGDSTDEEKLTSRATVAAVVVAFPLLVILSVAKNPRILLLILLLLFVFAFAIALALASAVVLAFIVLIPEGICSCLYPSSTTHKKPGAPSIAHFALGRCKPPPEQQSPLLSLPFLLLVILSVAKNPHFAFAFAFPRRESSLSLPLIHQPQKTECRTPARTLRWVRCKPSASL